MGAWIRLWGIGIAISCWAVGSAVGSAQSEVGSPPTIAWAALDPEVSELLRGLVSEAEVEPAKSERRGRLGLAYEANGIFGAARQAYEQATILSPDEARWWYHLARMQAQLGELEGAIASVERTLELDDTYPPAHWQRGLWQLEVGDLTGAERSLRAAMALDRQALAPRTGLARVFLRQGKESDALDLLEADSRRRPRDAYLHHLLATAYRQAGRRDEARVHAQHAALAKPPRWRDPWRDAQMPFEVGFGAQHKRAIRLAGAGQRAQAIALFERLRQERPQDVALASNFGATYLDAGEIDKALSVLLEALEHSSQSFELHLNLSTAYERQGRFDMAEEHVDRALEANPVLGVAHLQKGRYLVRKEQYDEALAAFSAAHTYDARTPGGLIWTGWVFCELGRWSSAVDQFIAAIEQDPNATEAHLGLAWAKAEIGELEVARRAFSQASRLGPGHPRMPPIGRRILALGRLGEGS